MIATSHTYTLSVGTHGFYIDASYYGNESRFVNHSCDPNSEIKPYGIKKIDCNILVAIKDIEIGEEITYHYKLKPYDSKELLTC